MWLHTVCTWNHIDGVVVSVIARIPVDREFEPFGLTLSGFELTIYRNAGNHTNHYTIDVVPSTYSM
jgi:hypothetical protein